MERSFFVPVHTIDERGSCFIEEVNAMSPEVKCRVSDCMHWESGDLCKAEKIQISVGQVVSGKDAFYVEFAKDLMPEDNEQVAQKMENTLCHTYVSREKAKA